MANCCLDNLSTINSLLLESEDFSELCRKAVELSMDFSKSDLASIYIYTDTQEIPSFYKKGIDPYTKKLGRKMELVSFLEDCREITVVHQKTKNPFKDIFLNESMESAIALPLFYKENNALLILNSLKKDYYNKDQFDFFKQFSVILSILLNNLKPEPETTGKNL